MLTLESWRRDQWGKSQETGGHQHQRGNSMDLNTRLLKTMESIHKILKEIKNGLNPELEEESNSEHKPMPEHAFLRLYNIINKRED